MSELPPPEAKRELNEAETAYFTEVLEDFGPLLSKSELLKDGEIEFEYNGQALRSVSQDDEAWFDVAAKRVLIERRFMAVDLPEEGPAAESVTWQVSVFDDGTSAASAVPSVEVFSVVKEGEIAGYAHYQRKYMVQDPKTRALRPAPPAELDQAVLEASREAFEAADNLDAKLRIWFQIRADSMSVQEGRRRELEYLTGIDDSTLFTPDRLYQVVELLRAIPR